MSEEFQKRVQPWMMACFGAEIAADKIERNHRFFEEATEAVQANGMTRSEAHQLVDYTFNRPIGELNQEIGGVMVTLAALCLASGEDMHAAGETELARIWTKVEQIRAKQAAKPKHSPLPEGPAILQAATPTGTTMTIDIINSAADATMSPDEREALDKFSDDTKQRLLNQILKRADAKRTAVLPNPDTKYIAPFTGHTFKYHSVDQIVEYANACVRAAIRDTPSADAKRGFAFAALSEAASICDAVAERFSEEPRAQYAADLAAQEIRILSEQWKAIAASAPKGDGND